MDLFEDKSQPPRIDPRQRQSEQQQTSKLELPYQGQMFRGNNSSRDEDVSKLYATYAEKQDSKSLGGLLNGLKPAIDKAVQRHVGTSDSLLRGKAKLMVAKALPKYDPSLASIETFVSQQTKPLIRYQSRRRRVLKSTDAAQLESARLGQAERAFEQENGRLPSTTELSDQLSIPVSRIEKLRKADKAVLAGSQQVGTEPESASYGEQGVYDDAAASMAFVNLIKDDLSEVDQTILEFTLGMNGRDIMSNAELAKRMNMSPGAISQRKARIQQMLDRESELNPLQ